MKFLLRTLLRLGGWLTLGALLRLTWQAWHLTAGVRHGSPRAWAAALALVSLGLAGSVAALWPRRAASAALWAGERLRRLGWWRWPVLALWVALFPTAILYSPYAELWASLGVRWLFYLVFAIGAALFFLAEGKTLLQPFLQGLVLTGAAFAFASAYTGVSAYPFSLSWAEGNWLWDYSLAFSRQRYVYPPDQPIFAYIDPGRQVLWGLIYLIPGVSIFWVRAWSAFLFTVPYLLFAWAIFGRPQTWRPAGFWAGLWGFLFLRQGPVYTPLVLAAWLTFYAAQDFPLGWGMVLTALAGYYATLTRFTWLLAVPLWAALLALGKGKEKTTGWFHRVSAAEAQETKMVRRAWGLGLAGLAGGALSGNLSAFFAVAWQVAARALRLPSPTHTSAQAATGIPGLVAHHPLLWERLWPNPTYPPGILLGSLLAGGPLLLLWLFWRRRGLWHLSRPALVLGLGTLTLFFLVGLLVSLKIGGGNNLHNLDMFLVTLLLLTAVFWQQGVGRWLQRGRWSPGEQVLLLLAVLVPMAYFLPAPARSIPPKKRWAPVLERVRREVHRANVRGGKVLFIAQRQLLTFGFVEPTPLVPDYEKKYMIDQAMAGNAAYFARYYHDLAHKRFALIVADPFRIYYEGGKFFAPENNAWMKWVVEPTLCFYRPLVYFKKPSVGLLVPRDEPQPGCLARLPVAPAP